VVSADSYGHINLFFQKHWARNHGTGPFLVKSRFSVSVEHIEVEVPVDDMSEDDGGGEEQGDSSESEEEADILIGDPQSQTQIRLGK